MLISASQVQISSQEVHIFGQVHMEISGQVCKEFCSWTTVVGIFSQAHNPGQACIVKYRYFDQAWIILAESGQAWNFCGWIWSSTQERDIGGYIAMVLKWDCR